ncbi:MAG: hypothetical protein WA183_16775 [Chthoniobacterales bacterium]
MREKGIDGRHAEADSLGLGLAADLLQFRVLRFRFFQDWDVGVGVLPEGEEVLVSGERPHAGVVVSAL